MGGFHFVSPPRMHDGLIEQIRQFDAGRDSFFSLNGPDEFIYVPGLEIYTLNANFEPHNNFGNTEREQRNYFRRAETRKKRILEGWADLNQLVVNYIKANITEDIESLPYQSTEPPRAVMSPCGLALSI